MIKIRTSQEVGNWSKLAEQRHEIPNCVHSGKLLRSFLLENPYTTKYLPLVSGARSFFGLNEYIDGNSGNTFYEALITKLF